MRQEDRELDGQDLEAAEERKRESELVEFKEDEVHDLDGKPEGWADSKRSGVAVEAMRQILAGNHVSLRSLDLDERELKALEAFKEAVEGKDRNLSRFVFAEDRRALLEQALAVLQPELADLRALGTEFEDLIKQVGELRQKLDSLEDSEEELVEGRYKDATKEDGDHDDDDEPEQDPDMTLDGPERTFDKPPTSLTGKPIQEAPKPPTSLTGKPIKEEPKPPTPLTGKELEEAPKPPTSLTGGKAVKDPPKGPTTLGDQKDIEAYAANLPRWRRPGE